MEWFSEWPCTPLKVESRKRGCTVLAGPGVAPKIVGAGSAGIGGVAASVALPFALAVPFPFNLVGLGAAALGGAIGATGLAAALASCRLTVEHGSGLWLWWRVPPLEAHELFIPREDIERFALGTETRRSRDDEGRERSCIVHVVELASVKGLRIPLAAYPRGAAASDCLREVTDALLRKDEPIRDSTDVEPSRAVRTRRTSRRRSAAKKAGPKRKPRRSSPTRGGRA